MSPSDILDERREDKLGEVVGGVTCPAAGTAAAAGTAGAAAAGRCASAGGVEADESGGVNSVAVGTNAVEPAVALASAAADWRTATGGGELRGIASMRAADASDAGAASEAAREDMARGCMTHTMRTRVVRALRRWVHNRRQHARVAGSVSRRTAAALCFTHANTSSPSTDDAPAPSQRTRACPSLPVCPSLPLESVDTSCRVFDTCSQYIMHMHASLCVYDVATCS